MNYQDELIKNLKEMKTKKTLLLHSCCAPCSSHCITFLRQYFDITIYYYNPNIEPYDEYEKRKQEQIKLCKLLEISYIDGDYDNDLFHQTISGLEHDKEGGDRCYCCIFLRLSKTNEMAIKQNFDYFGTTLTVSPHKNSQMINEIGLKLQSKPLFLISDFKKNNGYKESIVLAKKYELYRQNYCGCLYSK